MTTPTHIENHGASEEDPLRPASGLDLISESILPRLEGPAVQFRFPFLYRPCISVRRGAAIFHSNWPFPSADKEEMEQKRILELALEALQKRKMQIDVEIEALGAEMRDSAGATSKRKAGPTVSTQRKRRAKTPAERRAQSKRMKAYWAAKKAAVAAKTKKATKLGSKGRAKSAE